MIPNMSLHFCSNEVVSLWPEISSWDDRGGAHYQINSNIIKKKSAQHKKNDLLKWHWTWAESTSKGKVHRKKAATDLCNGGGKGAAGLHKPRLKSEECSLAAFVAR